MTDKDGYAHDAWLFVHVDNSSDALVHGLAWAAEERPDYKVVGDINVVDASVIVDVNPMIEHHPTFADSLYMETF
jgi:hypothetical protein